MAESVISVKGLCKSYKKTKVLYDFSLDIERGHICGLIGPNGAGKTTIIKILAGLMAQDSGTLEFFGGSDTPDMCRKRISFMIEAPIIDKAMTARNNLQYIRYLRGYPDEKRIDEVLDIVNLSSTGKKTVGKFSLGMCQRLGIAMALMTKPEVLVLDEPVNGLDPEGIVDVRKILERLCDEEDVTVLISSHLLSELSELCTDFSIINHGRLIENLSLEELNEKCRSHICLRTDDIPRTAALLEEKLSIRNYRSIHGGELHIYERLDDIYGISKAVTDSGLVITKLSEEGAGLEEYYLEKVGGIHE